MSVDICYNHDGTQLLKRLSVSHHVLFLSLLYKTQLTRPIYLFGNETFKMLNPKSLVVRNVNTELFKLTQTGSNRFQPTSKT